MKVLIAVVAVLLVGVGLGDEAGLRWDEATGAEGYYVYWRSPSTTFVAMDAAFYPVCAGYYDTTPPTLVAGVSCVDRALPDINVAVLPDSPPVLVLAVKAANEIGLSAVYSNEVRKHNQGADPVGKTRRTEGPPAPTP